MHRYMVYEVSDEAGETHTSIGKTVEIAPTCTGPQFVKSVMDLYGFTVYHEYYRLVGAIGDDVIKLRYNYNGPIHWALKKL